MVFEIVFVSALLALRCPAVNQLKLHQLWKISFMLL